MTGVTTQTEKGKVPRILRHSGFHGGLETKETAKRIAVDKPFKMDHNPREVKTTLGPELPLGGESMSFEQAIEIASRDERFKATVYAINSLLIQKGIYTQEEFDRLFVEWVQKETGKRERPSPSASFAGSAARA